MSKPLAVIQPGYNGLEAVALLDCQTIRKPFYIPVHVGTVEYVRGILEKLGALPLPLSYPPELKEFYKREIERMDIFFPNDKLWRLERFVKPYIVKEFEPFLSYDRPPDIDGWYVADVQEIVEFDQEYRIYCIGDKIVGHGRYDEKDSDDLDLVEVYQFVKQVINTWKNRPCAYAIDIGRIVDRGLAIVELTDAWAIGYYKPMSFEMYSKMLQLRWNEMLGQ